MSVTKGLLIVLVTGTLLSVMGGGSARAQTAEAAAASAPTGPHLGGEIVISALDNEQYRPSVAYNWRHDEYLVVWHNQWGANGDIYARRITGRGELKSWFAVAPSLPPNAYDHDRDQPAVAYDPTNDRYLVVWAYDALGNGTDWDIHGVFVNWNGPKPGAPLLYVSTWPTQQWTPQVAYSGDEAEFMIVWRTDHPSVPSYISGRRMTASDGTFPSTGSDFTISHATEERINPQISYNLLQNQYLVVHDNTEDILGSRFTGKGAPLPPPTPQNPLLTSGEYYIAAWGGAETQPSVAYCRENDDYLVAWQNPQPDIYARFVDGDGSLDSTILHLDFTGVEEIKPKVTCNSAGNQFLAVWQQQYSSLTGPYGVQGQFVNTDRTLGAVFGIMAPTSGVGAEFTTPVVAGGKVNYLTAWEHDRAGTVYQDIYGQLVTPHAVFLPLTLRNHQ
ncbi:MAG: hypothetical protein MUQ10_06285 [Anaerolineae bacterium]|nr:hypothetical protein [Anaerolineae bacterium]